MPTEMSEDDLVYLGAAILLAPMMNRNPDPKQVISREIQIAVVSAHFLMDEVKKQRGKIREIQSNQPLPLIEVVKKLSGES